MRRQLIRANVARRAARSRRRYVTITLVPSCGTPATTLGGDCAPAAVDPGVLRPSSAGTGRLGTACGAVGFTIAVVDVVQGKYRFVPARPSR